jgi:hypothetical protein
MFKGAYTDTFYRAVRDALHLEVDSWSKGNHAKDFGAVVRAWERVRALEPLSRNLDATELPELAIAKHQAGGSREHDTERESFVPLRGLAASAGEA